MSEFFPDKFTPVEQTVVGQAAALLRLLGDRSSSVGHLFVVYRGVSAKVTYDAFAAALTFLYGAGLIEYQDQMVKATQ